MPVIDPADPYHDLVSQLAGRYDEFATEQADIAAWYARQEADAAVAVDRAVEAVHRARSKVDRANSLVERADLEAHRLWLLLEDRTGPLGKPPDPASDAGTDSDPVRLLREVAERVEQAEQDRRARGELPGWMSPLLVIFGVVGACVGYTIGYGARWAALHVGGDIDAFAPVLRMILTAFAPLLGLVPAKLAADRAGGRLDGGHIGSVVVAGLLTVGVLLAF